MSEYDEISDMDRPSTSIPKYKSFQPQIYKGKWQLKGKIGLNANIFIREAHVSSLG